MGALLREFARDLWIAEGPTVSFLGFPYPTRMVVIRLAGGLFVWSPIELSAELQRMVDGLGTVRWIVSPNKLHHLFLPQWKAAHPEALLYAPPGLRQKRRDIAFGGELADSPEADWAAQIDQVMMRGSFALTEVVFFHRPSRTAIFGDLIQNFPRDWFKGWRGVVARLDGIVAPDPGAPREWRASFLGRRAARAALDRILAWPIARVLIAHGEPAEHDGADFVQRAFQWLSPGT